MSSDAASEAAISIRKLRFGYGREVVLDGIDLDIMPLDFLAVIGPNGGGKTTLVNLLLGLLRPWSGEIHNRLSERPGSLGYVPQYASFDRSFPLQVFDVVLMGRLGRRGPLRRYRPEDRAAAHAALARLDLHHLARSQVSDLSGGQVQRVLIARALASSPEILFLDEPTASIDHESRGGLREILLELNQEIPVVIVTHDLSSLPEMVKNVACLNRELFYHPGGEVSQETLEQVYGCHVDLIAHGHPHRVLQDHSRHGGEGEGT